MPATSMIWMLTLTALVALFPNEAMDFSLWLWFEFRVAILNARLMVAEWLIYRKLRRDFAKYGIEIPPFKFVPLQQRDGRPKS